MSDNPSLDSLQLKLHVLMDRYRRTPDEKNVLAVVRHLRLLLAHPRISQCSLQRETYLEVIEAWTQIIERQRQTLNVSCGRSV